VRSDMASFRILVVDPDPTTFRRVCVALATEPCEFQHARTVAEAEAAAAEGRFSVIFSALTLAGSSGYDLARRMRRVQEAAGIFLVHGGFEMLDKARARAAGVDGTLQRPLTASVLRQHVAPFLVAHEAASDDISGPGSVEFERGSDLGEVPSESIQPLDDLLPGRGGWSPLGAAERAATFIPSTPMARRVDHSLDPELERAVLAVLPEVVEIVLRKAAQEPGPVRAALTVALRDLVAAELPKLASQPSGPKASEPSPHRKG
jgi:CheY-like chemotaxis protein